MASRIPSRSGDRSVYTVIDETHQQMTDEQLVRLIDFFAAYRPRWVVGTQDAQLRGWPTDEGWADPATADTSQPYFLDLIARIDDVTEGP